MIDLGDIQWWQSLLGLAALLGLSPAPWILGLARNKIQFTATARADYDARIQDLKDQHVAAIAAATQYFSDLRQGDAARYAEMKASRDGWRTAVDKEREGREAAEQRLIDLGSEATRVAEIALQAVEGHDREGAK